MKKTTFLLILLCFILFGVVSQVLFHYYSVKNKITFCENIAPIIYKNCTGCHRPGADAPFDLITYQDVKKRAKMVKKVTETKFMPPWPADPTYSHFADEKFLSDEELKTISVWVDAGCPMGDSSKLPKPPEYVKGSQLGKPDLVIRMAQPHFIKGNNTDQFYLMKLPYEMANDTFVKAIEFVPGTPKGVHHVNGQLITYDAGKKKTVFGGEFIVDTDTFSHKQGFEKMDIPNDDGTYPTLTPSVTNYLPGVIATIYPDGIGGYKLAKQGAILFSEIHYGPSPIDKTDTSFCNVFFDKAPPKRPTSEIQLGTLGVSKIIPPLFIPPNMVKTFHTSIIVPMDISVLTVNPHMHLLGKKLIAYAIKPTGDTIPLIRINNWDFRWQYFYTYKKMLKIPAGSLIYVEGTYDNTSNNPLNPYHPPRLVCEKEGSMRVTDEMFQFIITYLPYQEGDEYISLENAKVNH
ncbi:MAG: cytochrome c [Bacteroidota bacterium]